MRLTHRCSSVWGWLLPLAARVVHSSEGGLPGKYGKIQASRPSGPQSTQQTGNWWCTIALLSAEQRCNQAQSIVKSLWSNIIVKVHQVLRKHVWQKICRIKLVVQLLVEVLILKHKKTWRLDPNLTASTMGQPKSLVALNSSSEMIKVSSCDTAGRSTSSHWAEEEKDLVESR